MVSKNNPPPQQAGMVLDQQNLASVKDAARQVSMNRGSLYNLIRRHHWGPETGIHRFPGSRTIRIDVYQLLHAASSHFADTDGDRNVADRTKRFLAVALPFRTEIDQLIAKANEAYESEARLSESEKAANEPPKAGKSPRKSRRTK